MGVSGVEAWGLEFRALDPLGFGVSAVSGSWKGLKRFGFWGLGFGRFAGFAPPTNPYLYPIAQKASEKCRPSRLPSFVLRFCQAFCVMILIPLRKRGRKVPSGLATATAN